MKRTMMTLVLATAVLIAIANAQPAPPANAALRYWMAFALLHDPPADQATAELLDGVASGTSSWDEAKLGNLLDENRQALEIMQRASALTFCDWGLEYELGSNTPIAHLAKGRVLGRLNGVEAARLVSRGELARAADVWLDGVLFSQHLARGGTLISLLSARLSLSPALKSLAGIARQLDPARRRQIDTVVRAIPESGFDWADAMRREADVLALAKRLNPGLDAPMPSQARVDMVANEVRAERAAVLEAMNR